MKRPKLDRFTEIIDRWLDEDADRPRKQRHTAKRVLDRLRAEHGFTSGYTIVKAYRLAQTVPSLLLKAQNSPKASRREWAMGALARLGGRKRLW